MRRIIATALMCSSLAAAADSLSLTLAKYCLEKKPAKNVTYLPSPAMTNPNGYVSCGVRFGENIELEAIVPKKDGKHFYGADAVLAVIIEGEKRSGSIRDYGLDDKPETFTRPVFREEWPMSALPRSVRNQIRDDYKARLNAAMKFY